MKAVAQAAVRDVVAGLDYCWRALRTLAFDYPSAAACYAVAFALVVLPVVLQ